METVLVCCEVTVKKRRKTSAFRAMRQFEGVPDLRDLVDINRHHEAIDEDAMESDPILAVVVLRRWTSTGRLFLYLELIDVPAKMVRETLTSQGWSECKEAE